MLDGGDDPGGMLDGGDDPGGDGVGCLMVVMTQRGMGLGA